MDTTIAAISTPLGTGGIGVVRISGVDAVSIADRIFKSYSGKTLGSLMGYRGLLGRILAHNGEEIDEGIAFLYRGPKSYTGEDVVEFSCHGGLWVTQQVLASCLDHGALPAGPGEFTRRAFLHGKMNLSQAESVMDLIAAGGRAAAKVALAGRDGVLSTQIDTFAQSLLGICGHLAAWADYPEEDIQEVEQSQLQHQLEEISTNITQLASTYRQGKILREGAETVIIGKPNVGKSTLMNLFTGTQSSIVTDIPGTTRDLVSDVVRVGDYTLKISDTAVIRDTADPVEKIGVERSRQKMQAADLILAVFDSSSPLHPEDQQLFDLVGDRPCIAVLNKSDMPPQIDRDMIQKNFDAVVSVSAVTGQGMEQLAGRIESLLGLSQLDYSAPIVMVERQRLCLQQAAAALGEALEGLAIGVTLDAVTVCIESAADQLLELSGKRATDQVVEQVFKNFCVGK